MICMSGPGVSLAGKGMQKAKKMGVRDLRPHPLVVQSRPDQAWLVFNPAVAGSIRLLP